MNSDRYLTPFEGRGGTVVAERAGSLGLHVGGSIDGTLVGKCAIWMCIAWSPYSNLEEIDWQWN